MSKPTFRLAFLGFALVGAQLTACSTDSGSNAATGSNATGADANADTTFVEGSDADMNTQNEAMSGGSTADENGAGSSNGTNSFTTGGSNPNDSGKNDSGTNDSDIR
jgi:hypothetical protein